MFKLFLCWDLLEKCSYVWHFSTFFILKYFIANYIKNIDGYNVKNVINSDKLGTFCFFLQNKGMFEFMLERPIACISVVFMWVISTSDCH